ncbi:exocyst complex component 3-like [Paramacrobiotus metropolitanus]|uniref:exocyst complex component 3-like n=1 Tax=Paramacrobiotus metropolitanus TaxID=2943436 RepID=UPI0024462F3D|nr:exocyst complex component 3-like [Paramacrobiotus metropolitanus]
MDQAKWKVIEESIADGASKNVAALLHQPKDLDEILRARNEQITSEKSTIDVMMKTMLQSHVEGVQLSIGNMDHVVANTRSLKTNFQGILKDLKEMKTLNSQFKEIREEHSRHSQLAAAVENAKQIFNVGEIADRTRKLIDEGKLLLAHQSISDLERSRDDLMFEFFKQPTTSHLDQVQLEKYFQPVESLSVQLGKQIWVHMGRAINIIRKEPALIVSCLRIIEREERLDAKALERKAASGFLPHNRPKQWKAKCFQVLEQSVTEKIEGSQLTDARADKTWLVKHLEIIRQEVLKDLSVVRSVAIPCFPPEYDIMNVYAKMYHKAIAKQIAELIEHEKMQAEDIVTLLTWLEEYEGENCLSHPNVQLDVRSLGAPLLAPKKTQELVELYVQATSLNVDNYLYRALNVEKAGWSSGQKPDESSPFYQTQTPTDVFQIFDQNINIAARMGDEISKRMYVLCLRKLADFSDALKKAVTEFKVEKFKDRTQFMNYTDVMMALVNDCSRYVEFIQVWAQKKSNLGHSDKVMECCKCFEHVKTEAISCLLEEVIQDLLPNYISEFFTVKWLRSQSQAMQTVHMTLMDYSNDYKRHLMLPNYVETMEVVQLKILKYYLQAILDRKLRFRSNDERQDAAKRIKADMDILTNLNLDLRFVSEVGGQTDDRRSGPDQVDLMLSYDIFENFAELLKCSEDMIQLELSTFVQKFPDVTAQQLARLLDVRGDLKIDLGDLNKNDGTKVLDVMSADLGKMKVKTIFSEVTYR